MFGDVKATSCKNLRRGSLPQIFIYSCNVDTQAMWGIWNPARLIT